MFPVRRILPLDVGIWGVFTAVIGIAHLNRTPVEQFLGLGFLAASIACLFALWYRAAWSIWAALTLVSGACLARASSALAIPTDWTGRIIIVFAWGHFSYRAACHAYSMWLIATSDREAWPDAHG